MTNTVSCRAFQGQGSIEGDPPLAPGPRRRSRLARTAAVLLLATGLIGAAGAQTVTRYQEDGQLVRGAMQPAALGTDLFGDRLDVYTGALSFEQTDVSLPGNSALPVAIGRRQATGAAVNRNSHFANWDLDIPHIKGVFATATGWRMAATTAVGQGERCSRYNDELAPVRLVQGRVYTPDNALAHLVVPGAGSQELLVRTAANTQAPTAGGPYPLVTQAGWQIKCLPGLASGNPGFGEGFLAISPAGVSYRFDWMASKTVPSLVLGSGADAAAASLPTADTAARSKLSAKPGATALRTASGGGVSGQDLVIEDNILMRSEVWLLPTLVSDRFGNTVRYVYSQASPMQLTAIVASDGRSLTLQYTNNLVSSVSDGSRQWQYSYGDVGGFYELTTVRQPDGGLWRFTGSSLLIPPNGVDSGNQMCEPGGGSLGPGAKSTTHVMLHPSGASGSFTLTETLHGRSHVDCYDRRGPSLIWFSTMALTRKALTGPGLVEQAWTYAYPAAQGGPLPCNGCSDRKAVVVTDPDGNRSRHVFGIRWRSNEGQLLQLDEGWTGSSALRSTSYSYRADTAGPYPAEIGLTANNRGSGYMAARHWPQNGRSVVQAGVSFNWQATGFDVFARPTMVTRSSGLGDVRGEQTQYFDQLASWVLGQTASVTETSTSRVVEQHAYDPASALRQASFSFGRFTDRYDYHPDGNLQTHFDAGGRPTSFSNYKRGLPQLIRYADATSESAVVNDLGLVTRHSNAAGSSTDYAYDTMGRLARVTYPYGDASPYHPTVLSFEPVTYPEYGLAAGHWRQTVATGNALTARYFDALWRLRLTRTWDAANPTATATMVSTRWDAAGRKTFESYPRRDIAAVDSLVPGTAWAHDALGRAIRQTQDSEIGLLTTRTDYLAGFVRQVTNPRGHVTRYGFQAFDTPSEDSLRSISAPEGVSVNIARDVFGKALAITRGGGGVSLTRSYVYDAHQRLCKTVEPETSATVQAYDTAGNLAWRASGLALPGLNNCDQDMVPAARRVSHGYDARNRLTSTTYGDGSPGITRSYTADGLPLQVGSAGATWTYSYNNRRLLVGEALVSGSHYYFARGVDTYGHAASLTYPTGLTVHYAPDALGRPTQVSGFASAVSYHPNGAVAGYRLANGVTHYAVLNTRGLPSILQDQGVTSDVYAYDANGNVNSITDQQEGIASRAMGYDGLDRLTAANGIWGAGSFAYDALDNLRVSRLGARLLNHNIDPATNRLSSLSGSQSIGLAYDANGNLARRGAQAFAFDIGNRLQSASGKARYSYDGHGRRVLTTYADGSSKLQAYSLDGRLLLSRSLATGAYTAHIYLGSKLIAEADTSWGVSYNHNDALGSPVARTGTYGQLLSRTRYEPYGATAAGTNPSGIGFTGHVNDADTGLVYMQQRYYDPVGGRFLSVDPVATNTRDGSFFGRYHYVNNNPYKYTDPDGRASCADKECKTSNIDPQVKRVAGGTTKITFANDDPNGASPNQPISTKTATAIEGVISAANVDSVNINSTTGGDHSKTSAHYSGRAIDIDRVDGKPVGANNAGAGRIQEAARSEKSIRENFGPRIMEKRSGVDGQPTTVNNRYLENAHKSHLHLSTQP